MMNQLIAIILFLFIPLVSVGQNWHYQLNEDAKFKHEYWCHLADKNDTNVIQEIQITASTKNERIIKGFFVDNKDSIIPYVLVCLLDSNDNKITCITSINGEFSITATLSKFKIYAENYLATGFHIPFLQEFELNQSQTLSLKIKLGEPKENTVYQINSKDKLTNQEVEEIIKCIKQNRNKHNSYSPCINKKRYTIVTQI